MEMKNAPFQYTVTVEISRYEVGGRPTSRTIGAQLGSPSPFDLRIHKTGQSRELKMNYEPFVTVSLAFNWRSLIMT
ncbi:hypothetical protein M514_23039 [Trichuris suis]|uniref:Uncharacterized protein n=1 Tax=Trichuris suis TaxID=68888 RepID=A0A085N5T1_9BILA|nr:hypothetical protein M514_23039 [Trichuris suis]